MATVDPSVQLSETMDQLVSRLGDIPLSRIHCRPAPGTATEDDFLHILETRNPKLAELIDGVIVEKTMGHKESMLAMYLAVEIGIYLKVNDIGRIYGADAPYRLEFGQVREPDMSFIAYESFPEGKPVFEPVCPVVPDLAVEILSPSNTKKEMQRKLDDYFQAGVKLVWYCDPEKKIVTEYTSTNEFNSLSMDDTLTGGSVLPGFELRVREWFSKIEN